MMETPSSQNTVGLPRIQKLIGERMQKSKQSKPCYYIGARADVTEMMAVRPKLSRSLGAKITSNTFLIRALALAVKEYPLMVGRIDGDDIRIAGAINVGFAVNAPQGLVMPVVKDADKKSLAEIAEREKLLTDKARGNRLTLEEIEGETVALSNLGAYGIDSFVGIVPLSISTILAVGNVVPTVISEDGKPRTRKIASLTLSVDGRVINEAYASKFLVHIKEQLQDPQELV
jgi:pyruvate dehydrogenase E2 component (dihydrolipoamide acetyltransferase)